MIADDIQQRGFLKGITSGLNRSTRILRLIFVILAFDSLSAYSQTQDEALIEEANRLFEAGQFQKAYGAFSQLVSLNPSSGDYNYKFGACSVYADADKTKAVRYLKMALKYNCTDPMVHYYLGRALHLNYQFKEAQDSYKTFISKANPKSKMISVAQLDMTAASNGSGLLSNIKDITVLNKTETDRVNFFRYYNLEGIGGRILSLPEELKTKLDKKNNHNAIIHFPGNGTTLYFSSYGKDGTTGKDIYRSNVLPDGTYSAPEKLGGGVNTNADEDFCFMHSDGATLFFSSTGHNSMGGYDVFRSLYDAANNHFSAAVNLDFAINTPDDDIFYIADSLKQRAYFASGRSSDLEHLHVYNVLVESTPLQVIYFKGSYSNEINPEETGYGYSIKEKSSGRVVCSGNARSSDGGYVSFVPKSGEYIMSVITSQSPKVHEVNLNIPAFQKPVAIRQEAKLIEQGGDKLIVETYFDTPLDEDLSALASDMLRSKARLEVNANEAPVVKKEEVAVMSTYERTMQNAAMIAGFGSGTTVESIMDQYKNEIAILQSEIKKSKEKADQAAKNAVYAQREAERFLNQAEQYKATGNPNQKATLDSLIFQMQLLQRADSLLILSAVFRESEKSLPELAIKKQNTLGKRNSSLEQLDSLYQLGNPESVISFLVAEKSNPEGAVGDNLLKPFENQFSESKQALVKEENKLTSLRKKELETSDDIKSNEAIIKRTTDAAERQIVESRLASLQQDLLADRQRILDQKLSIAAANRKVIQSEKLLTILKNPKQEIVAITAQDFTLTAPVTESQFTAVQTELTAKREALRVRDAKVQMMIEEARTEAGAPTTTSNDSAYAAKDSDATTNSQVSDSPINDNALSQSSEKVSSADNLTRDEKASGSENIAKLEAKYISELKLAEGRPDSLQIKSAAEYNATSALWVEKIRLEKALANENATKVDSIKYREVSESIERIAQNSPQRITPLEPAALSNELLRQDPEFIDKKLNLQKTGRAEEALDYKIQLIEQLMLTRSENAAALVKAASSQELTNIAKRDEEIERAVNTLLADDAEIKKVKLEYDSAMKVLIESDMDYPQKLTRQYDLTLKYEKQLARLEQAAAINGVNKETSAVKFVSSERGAVQVKLIAYKKELDRTQPSTQTDVAMSSTNSANSDRTEGAASNEGNIDANTTPSPSTNVGVNGSDNASSAQSIPASKSGQNDTNASSPITNATSNPESINSANPNISNTAANSTYTEATQNVAGKTNNTSNSESNNMNSTTSESSPVVINESAVFLTKANSAREEAGDLWQEKATPSPQLLLSKPAQIGFSKVIASPQFKSMLYTSQSGKPIQRLNEYENNEREIESIDVRMQAANGNLDTLRALDSRKNKLLSIQNKIEIENAEEYSRIVKRNYNEQRLATDKGMANLPSAARNRSVLSEAMLSKLRKADSLMVEAVILKSEAAWAYNEEEKADLFKMALAKQIQSIEMLRQVELMSVNSSEILTMSDAEIRAFARQTSGGVSTTTLADNPSAPSTNSPLISENQNVTITEGTANSISNIGANTTEGNAVSVAAQTSQNNANGNTTAVIETGASKTDGTENTKAVDDKNTTSSEEKIDASAQPNDNTTKTQTVDSNPANASNAIQNQQNIAEGIITKELPENKDASDPVYIDPYDVSAPENSNTAITTEAQHTLISEEKIPSSIEQKEMTRPEQAKWMISVLEEPEELPEIEVYDTQVMQELIEQQSAERSIKNKEQLIQLNQQILLLEDEMNNTTSKGQLRRLDYQREELYTQRASIEIENAAVIHEMAKHEYNERKLSADSVLNNSVMFNELSPSIQAIIKEKNRLSDSLLVQSLVFRAQAENGVEPLEKAYYYREGFACQVKSIELMQQVKSIVYAGQTLKTWSDSDLARMKDGKLPSELVSVAANTNESQDGKDSVAEVNSSLVNNNSINADAKTNSTEVKTENTVNSNTAPATSTASATAEEVKAFYYKSPDRVTSELSLLNAKGVYSVNNPIPLDAPLPKGVYYKVQVGAFRNKIPQNLFDGFAPLHGESVSNGVVRYTAGFYMTLDRAKSAKNQIRDHGYKDAFVVAYKDGIRIPIYEAIKASEGQEAADLFAANNPGAGPAKNSTTSKTDSKTNLTDVAANNTPANTVKPEAQNPPPPPPPLVTGYTKEYKDAAPSTEVETIQGVFFTVQVGVYTTPVPSSKLFNLKPLNTELTETKKIRYTTGRYDTLEGATARRDEIRTIGVTDAFVTAYVNGRRVTIAEALEKAKR